MPVEAAPRPTNEERIRAALWFAGRGFGIFSVWSTTAGGACRCPKGAACDNAGKHPITQHGFQDATTDPDRIRTFLSAGSDPNFGMVPPEGVFILDVDGDGIANLAALEGRLCALPPTLRTLTAHGEHVFLRWPADLPRPIGQLWGFVTRWGSGANAGYVIGPRSVHATGAVYAPLGGFYEIAEVPEAWAHDVIAPPHVAEVAIEISAGYDLPEPGYTGSRYGAILAFIASRYMRGIPREEILSSVLNVLAPRFAEPLTEDELRSRFDRAWKGTPDRLGPPMAQEAPRTPRITGGGMDAADLLALDLPPLRWLVPDLVPEGTTILAAPPKVGKSCLVYQIAVEASIGGELLGRRVTPGSVLYLALEDGKRRGQDRLKAVLAGRTMPHGRLEVRWDANRIGEGLEDDISAWLDAHTDAVMVAVDTLGKVKPHTDGRRSAYEVDVQHLARLQDLFRDRTVALVIVHHARKETTDDFLASVSGTYGLTGSADTIVVVKRKRLEEFGTVLVTGRDIADAEISVRFDGLTWKAAPGAISAGSMERGEVYRVVEEQGPIFPKAIGDQIGMERTSVQHMVDRLVQSGAVARTVGGYVVAGVVIDDSLAPARTRNTPHHSYPSESDVSDGGHVHVRARETGCPDCGRVTAITASGQLAAHYRSDDLGDAKWGRQPCPGSGVRPSAGWLNPCRRYPDHQSSHRSTPDGWTCDACYPEEHA